MKWNKKISIATHWKYDKNTKKAECLLCPRHCSLNDGQMGFCGVRGNLNNKLYTYNYGVAIPATIETIETEAVYHYKPGAKILSVGNVGCMLDCDFCQNWETSQVKFLKKEQTVIYSPQDIIDLAKSNNIEIISWTYNDPVVWHEFIMDTAKLAKENGLINLYKTSLYIEIEPLRELFNVIDIFSISFKSFSEDFYKKYTKGKLPPILKAIKEISKYPDKHLELSQLVVSELNDSGEDARLTAKWSVENLGKHIPLHFVAFHPAYRYTNTERTSLNTLLKIRNIAINEGVEYSYLGNVYSKEISDTYCKSCKNKLVQRYGLTVDVMGLDENNKCTNCGELSPIITSKLNGYNKSDISSIFINQQQYDFEWNKEENGMHLLISEPYQGKILIKIERFPNYKVEFVEIINGIERVIITKQSETEKNIKVSLNTKKNIKILPILDRAHFPTK